MKALITGANGFAGSHLVRVLLKERWEVLGITNQLALNPDLESEGESFKLEEIDICDKQSILFLIKKFKPEFVYHLAAITKGEITREAICELYRVNLEGTKNLLFSLIEAQVEATTLITGSGAIYGSSVSLDSEPISEVKSPNPETPYGASKLAQECLASSLAKAKNLRVLVTRAFNYTGPGENPQMACSTFAKQIVECEMTKGGTIRVGNLNSYRDYCDVRDVVRAYFLVSTRAKVGEVFNVCSGKAVQMRQVLEMLISESKVRIDVEVEPSRFRVSDTSYQRGDNSKIKKLIGWEPQIPLKKTLSDLLDFWRDKLSRSSLS